MTIIRFYSCKLHDVVAPTRTLRLEAGRGDNPEKFWLSNGSKAVFLDQVQAGEFLGALGKMDRCVRAGKLEDREFYSGDIQSYDAHSLGVDLGIKCGRPYIALEDTRVDVSPETLAHFAAACRQGHHLAGGIGPASRVARTPPTGRHHRSRVADLID